jgi:phage terminase large subunit-like protein
VSFAMTKAELVEALEEKVGLPHIHGWKWYQWAWDFVQAREQYAFLSAGNQISKSSSLIRLAIDWATNQPLWEELWELPPRQFWHLMPSKDLFTVEIEKKWIPEFLPKNRYVTDPYYGWELEKKNKIATAIHFKSGVSIYLKSYNQDVEDLQSGTIHLVSFDEELPADLHDPTKDLFTELTFRIERFDGYMRGVWTPTKGQEFWRRVMQPESKKEELLPQAYKRQVSMYECQFYMDGTPAVWSIDKIKKAEAKCPTPAAVAKRIHGKYVQDSNLKYPSFSRAKNVADGHMLPKSWHIYCGIDYGTGGTDGHPPAIVFVAVNPDYTQARVFDGWQGDDGNTYDAKAIIDKWRVMKKGWEITQTFYDYHAKDLHTIATGLGEFIERAEKGHEIGETILNTLFKNEVLTIYDYPQLQPLIIQLTNLKKTTDKREAIDDMVDGLRYALAKVEFNLDAIGEMALTKERKKEDGTERREEYEAQERAAAQNLHSAQDECDAWNELVEPEGPYD